MRVQGSKDTKRKCAREEKEKRDYEIKDSVRKRVKTNKVETK